MTQSTTQKHLGMLLDVNLDFQGHLKNNSKINKATGLLRKLHNTLPRLPLLTIYKSFIRPHLDYVEIIYDQAYTASFHQKIESVQYNSALAITGAIRGTSKEKLYDELGLETLGKKKLVQKTVLLLQNIKKPIFKIRIQYYSYFRETMQHKKC